MNIYDSVFMASTAAKVCFLQAHESNLTIAFNDKNYLIAALASGDAIKVNTGNGRRENGVKLPVMRGRRVCEGL